MLQDLMVFVNLDRVRILMLTVGSFPALFSWQGRRCSREERPGLRIYQANILDTEGETSEPGDRSVDFSVRSDAAAADRTPEKQTRNPAGNKSLRSGKLDSIEVDESDNRGVVFFSTNGVMEYDVYITTEFYRKWINIVFQSIMPDLPDHIAGGDSIIGEINLEKNRSGKSVKVSVEILPSNAVYEIFHQGDSLILQVTRQ
jgi:hypothetical protein